MAMVTDTPGSKDSADAADRDQIGGSSEDEQSSRHGRSMSKA